MRLRYFPFILLLLLVPGRSGAQNWLSLNGYLSDMQSLYFLPEDQKMWENTLHNRLNLEVWPTTWLTAGVQVRSRAILGNTLVKIPGYTTGVDSDPGWIDMNWVHNDNMGDSAGYLLTTSIDRLWLQLSFGNVEITAGRQRINWGQTFVWNPNDIFNSYSYFDVDYPERPGSDALRIQYYTGTASSIELAAKMDSEDRLTAAAQFRFNTLGYDIQFLGGLYQAEDLVLGTGWSGNLGPTAFRGEMSYFRDLDRFSDTTGYFMASAGFDYTFSNSLWVQMEGLYSSFAKDLDMNSFLQFYAGNMDVKNLAFTEWSLFGSLSFPFTPLINGSFAAIWFPEWKGCYLGPSFDLSLNNNIDLSLIFQYFTAEFDIPAGGSERQNNTFAFLRFKWSF